MIELVSESRCVQCDICVRVCPTNVFDAVPDGTPVIARQEDCQTCFMCELYCPTNALFVAPDADERVQVDETSLDASGALGSYRDAVGWNPGQKNKSRADQTFHVLSLMVPAKKPAVSDGPK